MWLAITTILLVAAGSADAGQVVVFPGRRNSLVAPDHSGARIFYRPHLAADGSQASPIFFDDGNGHRQRIGTVSRSVGVAWSSDGRRAFIQDNWGSNIADCYAFVRTAGRLHRSSLLGIIQKTPGHPAGSERPYLAHYYVHCDQWQSSGRITGSVSGHTDTNPSHDFEYPFIYEARTRRIAWRR